MSDDTCVFSQSYQPLRSLSEVTNVRDLNKDTVRDMLRQATSDHSLELVEMGQLEDMSGLNDAFNSTICRYGPLTQFGQFLHHLLSEL